MKLITVLCGDSYIPLFLFFSCFRMIAKCWIRLAGEWLEVPGGPKEPPKERLWGTQAMYRTPALPWEAGRTSDVFASFQPAFLLVESVHHLSPLCSGTWSSRWIPRLGCERDSWYLSAVKICSRILHANCDDFEASIKLSLSLSGTLFWHHWFGLV